MILCLDPGVKTAGVSLFEDDGTLHSAWAALGETWYETADAVLESMQVAGVNASRVHEVVLEKMQVYPEMPIPPAVLITLSLMAGRVTGRFAQWASKPPVEYQPKKWKGQVPKKIKLERIKSALTLDEISRVRLVGKTVDHNIFDAVGIGLYHLRVQRRSRV